MPFYPIRYITASVIYSITFAYLCIITNQFSVYPNYTSVIKKVSPLTITYQSQCKPESYSNYGENSSNYQ